ncbi:putative GMC oxidoreductase [Hypoxylon sp. CO27-5]|nr:putative GMC oxidoreductase [Hypoxylon sp. CO27-5]
MSPEEHYDFVVIGGGTAGLVVAARLSEDPNQHVLVLEAGADYTEDPRVKTPALYETLKNTEADWGFKSQAQAPLNGRSINMNQGKALGGSSAINAFVFVPPSKGIVDAWESLGNEGWNWETLQKYLTKAYTSPPTDRSNRVTLGIEKWATTNNAAKGPIQTSFSGNITHPIRQAWVETFTAVGYCMKDDPFINPSVGAFSCLASIHPETRERSYSASAYYNPVKDRRNLHVLTNAEVVQILFNQMSNPVRATGVQYKHEDKIKTVSLAKEVILAAGALQSPKILELSGVGNPTLLNKYGIDVVVDLPVVGENLHDHAVCSIGFEAIEEVDTLDALARQEPEALTEAMREYAAHKTGPLSHVGVTTYAYLPIVEYLTAEGQKKLRKLLDQNRPPVTEGVSNARDRAYYEVAEKILLDPNQPTGAYLSVAAQSVLPVDTATDSPQGPVAGKFISIGAMLTQPLSRGTVHIQSNDPSCAPSIDPRYLSNPVDMDVLANHMLYIETIARSSSLNRLLKQPLKRRDPASELTDLDAAKRYLRTSMISMWHMAGTCAMLPKEKGGVVDKDLVVYGVKNLRVVDSSAIPIISTANLQATVYAFAERAADLIKEAWSMK